MKNNKNVFVLPTDKPSRLHYFTANKAGYYLYPNNELVVPRNPNCINQNIYITSDEEINQQTKPCWCINTIKNTWDVDLIYYQGSMPQYHYVGFKKIILTTDQDLIKDGVQKIDDEFLEWFAKNPSCEEIDVQLEVGSLRFSYSKNTYKIIIPKEEPKERLKKILGTKHTKQERMYSEEEVFKLICDFNYDLRIDEVKDIKEWFEQFKKK